jgi:hypothetical protein
VGTHKPDGYGFGPNFKPVMGTGFLMSVNIFHGYEFGISKPGGFVPVAISTPAGTVRVTETVDAAAPGTAGPRSGGGPCRAARDCRARFCLSCLAGTANTADQDSRGPVGNKLTGRDS